METTETDTAPHECRSSDAVYWNPYNKVVQCHECGTVYEPVVSETINA